MLDGRLGRDVLDLEHVDQPVELLRRLLDGDVVAVQGDRHPAHVRPVGVADRQRLDVEVAGAHEARDAVEDAGLVEDDRHEHVATLLAATRQRPRGRRRVGRAAGGRPRQLARSIAGVAHSLRPAPRLDQVGQALAGGHHREDVLLLGDLEPDEGRPVDGLGGADGGVDLVGRRGPEGRDAVRVGELRVVRARQVRRVVVAGVDDLLPLADHPELLVVEEGDLHRDAGPRRGSSAPGSSSGSRRRRRSPRSPGRAGRGPRPWPPGR